VTTPALDPDVINSLRQLNHEGEPDVVREVLTLFVDDAPTRMTAIAEAAERRDGPALQRAAHSLKGAAGNIGASALQACCRDLEAAGRSGAFDQAPALLETMRREFERIRLEIARLL
jgi:HPt (histidine-containing phosphotransfer) domain-containing protein